MKPPRSDLHDLLDAVDTPSPPPDLRRRSLVEARLAMARSSHPNFWEHLWSNRGLRLAWAASMTALVVGHLVLISPAEIEQTNAPGGSILVATQDPELEAEIALPRIRITERANLWLGGGGPPARPVPGQLKENES